MINNIRKLSKSFNSMNKDEVVILKNIVMTFFIKGGALIISLLTTPAFIEYFDNQVVLGLWFTLLSVLSWILNFDLGIGNGLRNKLVEPIVNKDQLSIKKYISSAYISVGIIVILILGGFYLLTSYIDWNTFFNISTAVIPEKTMQITVNIIFSGIMIQFFLKLIVSVFHAMQKSALQNFLSLINSVLILSFVAFAKFDNLSVKLIILAIVYTLSVNIPLFFSNVFVFHYSLKESKPNFKFFEYSFAKDILKLGGNFFWIQIMYMILNSTNEFLISWLTDPAMVVEYQLYNKIFLLMVTLFSLILTPIWSAVTKASSEKNFHWIDKLYKKLLMLAFISILVSFALVPSLQYIFDIWLDDGTIKVNYFYAIVFVLYAGVNILNSVYSSIANGLGLLKPQMILFTGAVIVKIPLSILLVGSFNSWIYVVVAYVISLGLYCILQPIFLNKYIQERL